MFGRHLGYGVMYRHFQSATCRYNVATGINNFRWRRLLFAGAPERHFGVRGYGQPRPVDIYRRFQVDTAGCAPVRWTRDYKVGRLASRRLVGWAWSTTCEPSW
jgi:hypothetical protein